MEKIATITTNPSEGGRNLLQHIGEEFILELDTAHDDGEVVFVVWETDGIEENRISKIVTEEFEK